MTVINGSHNKRGRLRGLGFRVVGVLISRVYELQSIFCIE